jgi:hypothetical protein
VTVTDVAPVAVTVKVDEAPAAIDAGFALIATVGAPLPAAPTVTVALAVALPPAPLAVAV